MSRTYTQVQNCPAFMSLFYNHLVNQLLSQCHTPSPGLQSSRVIIFIKWALRQVESMESASTLWIPKWSFWIVR
jgi:hypothetical protein